MSHCHLSGLSMFTMAALVLQMLLMNSLANAFVDDFIIEVSDKTEEETSISIQTHDPSLALNRFTFDGNVLAVPGSGNYRVENWIVVYCVDWFEPCKDLSPLWSTLSSEWQSKLNNALLAQEVRFARVDCAVDKVLCNERNVDGYPVIQHVQKGKVLATISGFRSQSDMQTRFTKWLVKNLAPKDGESWPDWMSSLKQAIQLKIQPRLSGAAKGGITVLLALGATALTIHLAGNPQMKEKTAPPTFGDMELVEPEPIERHLPARQLIKEKTATAIFSDIDPVDASIISSSIEL